ncbi:E3 ubiquitin-protein ligase RNF181 [Linum perenne]
MMMISKVASLICNSITGLKTPQRVVSNAASLIPKVTVWDVAKSIKEGMWELSSLRKEVRYEEGSNGECSSVFCCICLMQMETEESDLEMLPCQHLFHKVCIEKWLKRCRRRSCPLCRFSMVEDEKSEEGQHLTEEMLIWFSSFHVAGF